MLKAPKDSDEAGGFLRGLGFRVREEVVGEVVRVLLGQSDRTKYDLYQHGEYREGGDRKPICGKGTVYKIAKLHKEGKLSRYVAFLRSQEPEAPVEATDDQQQGGDPQALAIHRRLLRDVVERVVVELRDTPPVPRALFEEDSGGGTVAWTAAHSIAEVERGGVGFKAVSQHLEWGFETAYKKFCDDLKLYERSAHEALQHVETSLEDLLPQGVFRRAALPMFVVSADKACVNCGRYRCSQDDAYTDFPLLREKPTALHPDGSRMSILNGQLVIVGRGRNPEAWSGVETEFRVGPWRFGAATSYESAESSVRALSELDSRLSSEGPLQRLAKKYFEVRSMSENILERLKPIAVEKWIADGRCQWCPAGGMHSQGKLPAE